MKYRIIKNRRGVFVQEKMWIFWRVICEEYYSDYWGVGSAESDLIPINFRTIERAGEFIRDAE